MTSETKKNAAFFYKDRKRMQRTFRSFIKNGKEQKNVPFFYKKQKRMQKTFCSFIKNGKNAKNVLFFYKERKRTQERCILLKRTDAQPWINGVFNNIYGALEVVNKVHKIQEVPNVIPTSHKVFQRG